MSDKKLKRLHLNQSVKVRLSTTGFNCARDLLQRNENELIKLLGYDLYTVQDLQKQVSQACIKKIFKAKELWEIRLASKFPLGTSLAGLDHVLRGGLARGSLTEVAGPAGSGKTQFCLTLAVTACLPMSDGGLGGAVIYIDTESAFSASRLMEIATTRYPGNFLKDVKQQEELGKRIHVYTESTCAEFQKRLDHLEEHIIEQGAVLIIVDSIASLVRKEYDGGVNGVHRTNLLAQQAARLKELAEKLQVVVVVTNQITTTFNTGPSRLIAEDNMKVREDKEAKIIPALGNTWSHCVNTRLTLQYTDSHYRQMMIAKSPVAPFTQFSYAIVNSGIQLLDGGANHYRGGDPGLQMMTAHQPLDVKGLGHNFI